MTNRIVVDNQLINFEKVIQANYDPKTTKLDVEFENGRGLSFSGDQASKIWHALRGEPEIVVPQDSHRMEEITEIIRHG